MTTITEAILFLTLNIEDITDEEVLDLIITLVDRRFNNDLVDELMSVIYPKLEIMYDLEIETCKTDVDFKFRDERDERNENEKYKSK